MPISTDNLAKLDALGHPWLKTLVHFLSDAYCGIDEVADTEPIDQQIDQLIERLQQNIIPEYVSIPSLSNLLVESDFLHWLAATDYAQWNPLRQSFNNYCLKQSFECSDSDKQIEGALNEDSPTIAVLLYNRNLLRVESIEVEQVRSFATTLIHVFLEASDDY
ncbi:MAG: hypothetical protein JHC38_07325 [Thiotrichales bacterium]|jgi:hypothetical protein|nr:hypothetical protein [Thiotrichales bacterium]